MKGGKYRKKKSKRLLDMEHAARCEGPTDLSAELRGLRKLVGYRDIGVELGGKGEVPLADLLRGGELPPEDFAILTL